MAEADKICFLFGAGAEVGFNIAGGGDFTKDVLGISDEGKAMTDAIAEYYKKGRSCLVGTETDGWYPVYTRRNWKKDEIKKAAVMTKFLFEKSDEIADSKKSFETIIKREIKNTKDSEIEKYLSYKGLIDANFHTIIAPNYLGPIKFWQVVNCYNRAYLSVISGILLTEKGEKLKKNKYLEILQNPKEKYEEARKVCAEKIEKNGSYYKSITDHPSEKYCFITTNYTPFINKMCENLNPKNLMECKKKHFDNVAYLNGRLGLYESAYRMKVYDVYEEELPEDDYVFPFLFVQSGVKPIVSMRQIEEYSRMERILKKSKILIILGYQMNLDDNHINGSIRWFLEQKDKKAIYCNYIENNSSKYADIENEKRNELLKKLRFKQDEKINLEVRNLNGKNATKEFEDLLREL